MEEEEEIQIEKKNCKNSLHNHDSKIYCIEFFIIHNIFAVISLFFLNILHSSLTIYPLQMQQYNIIYLCVCVFSSIDLWSPIHRVLITLNESENGLFTFSLNLFFYLKCGQVKIVSFLLFSLLTRNTIT